MVIELRFLSGDNTYLNCGGEKLVVDFKIKFLTTELVDHWQVFL